MSATASSHSQPNGTQIRTCKDSQGESLQNHRCCGLGSYARVVDTTYSWLEEAKDSGDQEKIDSAVQSVLRALENQDSIVRDLDSENNGSGRHCTCSYPFRSNASVLPSDQPGIPAIQSQPTGQTTVYPSSKGGDGRRKHKVTFADISTSAK